MKRTLLVSVLAAAMGLSTCASATQPKPGRDEAKLRITAGISSPSCSFDLNGGMTVDLGVINPAELHKDQSTERPSQSATLNITCEAMTMVTLSLVDTYADAVTQGPHADLFPGRHGPSRQFALVDTANSNNLIGSYIMNMTETRDSQGNYYNMHGLNTGYWGDFLYSSKTDQDRTPETAVFTDIKGAPQYIKDLTIDFLIVPQVLPSSKIKSDLNSVVDITGETTFKVVYM